LEKSVFLIRASGKRALQDIALSVGFSSQASFAKALKAYYGIVQAGSEL
jgi:AraC-like DNA-binding protein